jgi:hypothetical protein
MPAIVNDCHKVLLGVQVIWLVGTPILVRKRLGNIQIRVLPNPVIGVQIRIVASNPKLIQYQILVFTD